jgi:uncharacterized protein with PIN domain
VSQLDIPQNFCPPLWITLWITFTTAFTTLPKILHNIIVIKAKSGVSIHQMSVVRLIIEVSRKEKLMARMAELFEERNSIIFDVAECAECGDEIEFSTDEEFTKLVNEHACTRLV